MKIFGFCNHANLGLVDSDGIQYCYDCGKAFIVKEEHKCSFGTAYSEHNITDTDNKGIRVTKSIIRTYMCSCGKMKVIKISASGEVESEII